MKVTGRRVGSEPEHLLQFALDSQDERAALSEALLNISGVGIGLFDDHFRFKALNRELATINGAPLEAHLGKTLRDILGSAADLIEPKLEQVRSTGASTELEFCAKLPARPEEGHWIVKYFPVKSEGAIVRICAIVTEIDEKRTQMLSSQGSCGIASSELSGSASGIRRSESQGELVGTAPSMQAVYRSIERASHHDFPVVILGESGTGKELVARTIHSSGPRKNLPFVPVDCSAIAATLFESELFGYVRGAFTGAAYDRKGLFEAAHTGTLFLDEIGELSRELQAKLLRAVQEKEIRRVGSTQTRPINVRVIVATNRDLQDAVRKGDFREDLYYRLNVFEIKLPPLRERRVDIPLLIASFLRKHPDPLRPITSVSNDFTRKTMAYDWPGNVRELENLVERCVALGSGPILRDEDRCMVLRQTGENMVESYAEPLRSVERRTIMKALSDTGGDKLRASRILGIGKTTLYRKLKGYEQP